MFRAKSGEILTAIMKSRYILRMFTRMVPNNPGMNNNNAFSVLYRVLFHHFDRFLTEYESRFEREYGFFRPIVKEVVEKYLDCGNPKCGFARIRCPDCAERPEVYFRRGQIGRFIGRSRNSWRHEKRKYLSLKLLADAARLAGGWFSLKSFLDDYFARGIIPASLLRWEITGLDDEIKALLKPDAVAGI